MPTPRDFAPGPGWRPPGELVSKSGRDSTADYLNSIAGVAARANHFDLGTPGIHYGHAFHPTPDQQKATGSSLVILLLEDALLPGTYDLPGMASGYVMESTSSGTLVKTGDVRTVVNYSTSIYAPVGGLVLSQTFGSLLVATGSSN
jgi:hypothetical protein